MTALVDALQEMGLSLNEAKAYQALLRDGPANGYEVSKRASITRSVVYGVLDRLLDKGLVLQVDSEPIVYAPLPPSQLMNGYRETCTARLDRLEESLARVTSGIREDAYILGVSGYDDTIRKARELIGTARREIVLSAWGSDCAPLRQSLEQAERAGKKVVIFCHTTVPFKIGTTHQYGLAEDIVQSVWPNRRIILAIDCRTVLIGDIETDANLGIVTENPTIVQMAVEHVILDIMHLAQIRAGLGNPVDMILSGDDYIRLVRELHECLGLVGDCLPSATPMPL